MHRPVKIWLYAGVFMVLVQIFIGGVTRLTGSGLSITKWEIITGTFPPMSEEAWQEEFNLYKDTPQYKMINEGMSMDQFKFIYFWEYFHRLWARMLGLVFVIPFLIFWRKGWINRKLGVRLGILVLLGALVASFGWIMVASGLVERPWVNAYKLMLHLGLGTILFLYIWRTATAYDPNIQQIDWGRMGVSGLKALLVLVFVQLLLGGLMSGMKAGLFYPTWPDMNGEFIPAVLKDASNWRLVHLTDYDSYAFAPALIQVLHRNLAYIIGIFAVIITFRQYSRASRSGKLYLLIMNMVLLLQILLGVLTVISCKGHIPVTLGVLHQLVAILLLAVISLSVFNFKSNSVS